MSYLTKSRNIGIIMEGNASVRDIHTEVKKYGYPLPGQFFYELEPAEVISVYLDEIQLIANKAVIEKNGKFYPDYSKYGWIRARMDMDNNGSNDIIEIAPLDSNVKEYPRPHEHVIVATYLDRKYYTQKLNIHNSVNFNMQEGISIPFEPFAARPNTNIAFVKNTKIRQLQADEGDITFNGRFGQSIRFGSNTTKLSKIEGETETVLADTGEPESPNIIMRAGQGDPANLEGENVKAWNLDDWFNRPVREDINNDGSSIWITTNQTVPLKEVVYSKLRNRNVPKLDGKQIILNSDRIVFNAKKSHIFMSAEEAIDISANHMITLQLNDENVSGGLTPKRDSGKLKLGDMDADQPVLGGNQTMILIERLAKIIEDFAKDLIPATGITTAPGSPVPISQINVAAAGLNAALALWRTRLDEPKSKSVMVAHIIGPQRK
tara:strand:- start:254 stop:1558 length:1305 start_codon:yes stop_codon:yes gene_type:complete